MPIRPENRARYGPDWDAVSLSIKERAGWRCECHGECGRPPGHLATADGRCHNRHRQPAYATGSLVILTTAHLNHTPEDHRPEVLLALCQGCHLHLDRDHHRETRARTRREAAEAAGQDSLFREGG